MTDWCARIWERLGEILGERPVQIILYFVAVIAVAVALTVSLTKTSTNHDEIERVKSALCNVPDGGPTINVEQCQLLFDRLLEHPTDAQVKRLRQIVREGK